MRLAHARPGCLGVLHGADDGHAAPAGVPRVLHHRVHALRPAAAPRESGAGTLHCASLAITPVQHGLHFVNV